jgi:hypothetical protein
MDNLQIPKWEYLVKCVLEWPYESIHSHDTLEILLDTMRGSNDYYNIIARANKSLLFKGKILTSVHGVGYQVLKPDKYSSHSSKIFNQGNKRIKKAKNILEYAPTKYMSIKAKDDHQKVLDRVSSFSALIEGGCKEIKLLQNNNVIKHNSDRLKIGTEDEIEDKIAEMI